MRHGKVKSKVKSTGCETPSHNPNPNLPPACSRRNRLSYIHHDSMNPVLGLSSQTALPKGLKSSSAVRVLPLHAPPSTNRASASARTSTQPPTHQLKRWPPERVALSRSDDSCGRKERGWAGGRRKRVKKGCDVVARERCSSFPPEHPCGGCPLCLGLKML